MNREQAIELARKHAKSKPQSYYAEPFEPHEWVIDAVLDAANVGAEKERHRKNNYKKMLRDEEDLVAEWKRAVVMVANTPCKACGYRNEPLQPPGLSPAQHGDGNDDNGSDSGRGQQSVRGEGGGPAGRFAATAERGDSGDATGPEAGAAGIVRDPEHSRGAEGRGERGRGFPLLMTNEWLRKHIAADPDDGPEAGPAIE